MVIKANELVNKIKKTEFENFKKAEEAIDKKILKNFDGEKVDIGSGEVYGLKKILREELFSKYKTAGWNIKEEFDNDPRGGSTYYIFTPKNKINYDEYDR